MRKTTGDEAEQYITDEMKKKGGTIIEIPNTSAEKVNEYYQKIYDASNKRSKRHEDGKVIDIYAAPSNTCVTKTIEGVIAGGGTVPQRSSVAAFSAGGTSVKTAPITPQQLKDALKSVIKPEGE